MSLSNQDLEKSTNKVITNHANKSLSFRDSHFWKKLATQKKVIEKLTIKDLFTLDPARMNNFCFNIQEFNMIIDFSKQHLNLKVLQTLSNAAEYCQLNSKIQQLFNGDKINTTENKPAWHTMLRDAELSHTKEIADQLAKIEIFQDNLYKSNYKNIVCLGIGGSHLGPMMVTQALDQYTNSAAKSLKFYFIANPDQDTKNKLFNNLDPNKTILIINSKSFTTPETMLNAQEAIAWLQTNFLPAREIQEIYKQQIFAVTSNVAAAINFGIVADNIFSFPDHVGGRYSIWSTVGLSIIIKIGMNNFKKFLRGASIIDNHFKNTSFINNVPIIMALISIWNINFMHYKSLAIIPYLDALEHFPSYLQQLAMESNGKTINLQNACIDYDTVEVVWGGVGSNVQHSFMQMIHQGSQIVPVDFLCSASNSDFLAANCLAQSQALMEGNQPQELFKKCLGNRPSTTILFPELTPEVLGALLAMYEHKTFVQGVLWNINSFDQWGVELGKKFAKDLLNNIHSATSTNKLHDNLNPSTSRLIAEYQQMCSTEV